MKRVLQGGVRYCKTEDFVKRMDQNKTDEVSLSFGDFLIHFERGELNYLPDGTDKFHWPGDSWVRRVWAGGSITWDTANFRKQFELPDSTKSPGLSISRKLRCFEKILNVELKGKGDRNQPNKILVQTMRAYGAFQNKYIGSKDMTAEMWKDYLGSTAIIEKRDLIFMPLKTTEEAEAQLNGPDRVIKPKMTADHSLSIIPNEPLLAEFSCLTHNCHRIHLDKSYARSEGYRDLVVHGPLTLYLMIKELESHIPAGASISRLDYKNLAPLFCNEMMNICLRRSDSASEEGVEQWDVWIEGSHGGYAVKGRAEVQLPTVCRVRGAQQTIG